MHTPGRLHAWSALAAAALLVLGGCGPANERPVRGAVPGSESGATPPGVPPTLTASEALRFKALPTPSPGLAEAGPSPSAIASPSAVAGAPPIVRTIAPSANAHVPAGSTMLSAILIGRGADLASASLSLNGGDTSAQIDKHSAREWLIHANQLLANGTQTAKVLVRDSSGANGGFTWQFVVGEEGEPAPAADQSAQPTKLPAQPQAPAASPAAKPRSP